MSHVGEEDEIYLGGMWGMSGGAHGIEAGFVVILHRMKGDLEEEIERSQLVHR